jgi:galactokinase
LPIIAAAINLRITIRGYPRKDRIIRIYLPDIGEEEEFSLAEELSYSKERDYFKSSINVLKRKGVCFSHGWNCELHGTIPINAGTSSSSALVIAWLKFLLEAAGNKILNTPEQIAELGFLSEVAEFSEPGGKMDHYASSLGGVVSVSFKGKLKVQKLKNPLNKFILADSLQKKDTTGMLGDIKSRVFEGVHTLRRRIKGFSLYDPLNHKVDEEIEKLPPDVKRPLRGTLLTRNLTEEGRALFASDPFDHLKFGQLLSQQQEILRDYLRISTPKIDTMIDRALKEGALGAKINGSGGGGCMFAYAPVHAEKIAEAVKQTGASVAIIHVDDGARREMLDKQDKAWKKEEK